MKANELMIGDWVQKENVMQCINYLNGEEDRGATDKEYLSLPIGCFEPIPLTEEILKVNGFTRIDENCKWYKIIGYIFYDICNKELNVLISGDSGLPICNIVYVHELQHALRLCGLNDLADNFKIE